jgi:hypothetical protein
VAFLGCTLSRWPEENPLRRRLHHDWRAALESKSSSQPRGDHDAAAGGESDHFKFGGLELGRETHTIGGNN